MNTDESSIREESLDALRARLDGIDNELLDQVRRRIGCCVDIAHYKREHGVPMMQPERVRLVHDRAARYGALHGLDPAFLRRLYQLIIDETCRVEDTIIGATGSVTQEEDIHANANHR